nr:G2/M phase-specific E3 ubiquitin-protein ligase-like isoform X2 [Geotrypetes seraphini]XP_033795665.1 G2/M phase-specific E3 ubiquitin-protein ligase-like isoform X2 [Geotrypetes seraphini]
MRKKLITKNSQTSSDVLFQEPVCGLCGRTDNNIEKYGERLTDKKTNLSVHYYCLILSSGLWQHGKDNEGFYGFLLRDVRKEIARASKQTCSICMQKGASIGCSVKNCRKNFHFPCGLEKECMFQFFQKYGSYCWEHTPTQKVAPENKKAVCAICLDTLQPKPSYSVLKSPCCRYTWFHRICLQKHALSFGLYFFKCPICNNKETFQKEMLHMGIHIPERDASWESEENAFSELLYIHQQCDVEDCLCNKGRKYFESNSKWYILRCCYCGSRGTHLICSDLGNSQRYWTCSECISILSRDSEKASSLKGKQLARAMSNRNKKNKRSLKRTFQTRLEGSAHTSSSVSSGNSRRSDMSRRSNRAGSKPAKRRKKQERKGKQERRGKRNGKRKRGRSSHCSCRLSPSKSSKRCLKPFSRRGRAGRR